MCGGGLKVFEWRTLDLHEVVFREAGGGTFLETIVFIIPFETKKSRPKAMKMTRPGTGCGGCLQSRTCPSDMSHVSRPWAGHVAATRKAGLPGWPMFSYPELSNSIPEDFEAWFA